MRTVVLVEGVSDRLAVAACARGQGLELEREGIAVVDMGGSKNVRRYLAAARSQEPEVRVAGLCDADGEGDFRRAFGGLDEACARLFVCVEDLEDELIRALGADAVQAVLRDEEELELFRSFQKQPAWRGRGVDGQLRRFIGTHSGRKIRLAPRLVQALARDRQPAPLRELVGWLAIA
jgi:hypothetical protein